MTDRWLPAELEQFLLEDRSVRLLFVEGEKDLVFWRHIAPQNARPNAQIYSLSAVEVFAATGGNKGRALALANHCAQWEADAQARVWFFLDSDCDRFLDAVYPPLVSSTDGRDMEAYVLQGSLLSCLCELGAGEKPIAVMDVRELITKLLRPVGLLRIASAQQSWNLPFQATLAEGSLRRFFRQRRENVDLRFADLIFALLDKADHTRSISDTILAEVAALDTKVRREHDWQIVHGKDLVAFFSWYFDVPLKIASGLVALSLAAQVDELRELSAFGHVDGWLKAH